MENEIRSKIELLKQKMETTEVGSVQQVMYSEILRELEEKLVAKKEVKLHVEGAPTCEGCQ